MKINISMEYRPSSMSQMAFLSCISILLMVMLTPECSQCHPTSQDESEWCRNYSRVFEHSFTWIIRDYDAAYYNLVGEPINSSMFPADATGYPSKWQLQLYPRGFIKELSGQLSLYLYLNSTMTANQSVMATYRISIIDNEHNEGPSVEVSSPVLFNTGSRHGADRLIRGYDVYDLKRSLLPDNQMTIHCEVHEYVGLTGQSSEGQVCASPDGQTKLLDDFGHLLETGDMSDVAIEVAGREFKAHKAILGASSPVFQAMFSYDMRENEQGRVQVDDMEANVFEELLRYVYTGNCVLNNAVADDIQQEMALKLLEAAVRFQIEDLRAVCEYFISKNLDVESVVDVLSIVEFYHLRWLKDRVYEFIFLHVVEFTQSGGWDTLIKEKPELLVEVLSRHWPAKPQLIPSISSDDDDDEEDL